MFLKWDSVIYIGNQKPQLLVNELIHKTHQSIQECSLHSQCTQYRKLYQLTLLPIACNMTYLGLFSVLSMFLFCFGNKDTVHSPGWPKMNYISQIGTELVILVTMCQVLRCQVCTIALALPITLV